MKTIKTYPTKIEAELARIALDAAGVFAVDRLGSRPVVALIRQQAANLRRSLRAATRRKAAVESSGAVDEL